MIYWLGRLGRSRNNQKKHKLISKLIIKVEIRTIGKSKVNPFQRQSFEVIHSLGWMARSFSLLQVTQAWCAFFSTQFFHPNKNAFLLLMNLWGPGNKKETHYDVRLLLFKGYPGLSDQIVEKINSSIQVRLRI